MPRQRQLDGVWRDRIERWKSSGLGRKEFAAQEGVNPSTLSWWRGELVHRDAGAQSGRAAAAAAPVVALARVTVEDRSAVGRRRAALELLLPGRRRIRVLAGFDAPTLERLLAVLEGRP